MSDESRIAPPEIEHAGKVKWRKEGKREESRWMEHREGEKGWKGKQAETEEGGC